MNNPIDALTLIQSLEILLAKAKAQNDNGPSFPDNLIVIGDSSPTNGATMCEIKGPYFDKDRKKNPYRIKVIDTDSGKQTSHSYQTEAEALAAIPTLERDYMRPIGVSVREALTEYSKYLVLKGNRPRSIETTQDRIYALFPDETIVTGTLTTQYLKGIWETWANRPSKLTRNPPSVSSKVAILSETKTFLRWLEGKGWVRAKGMLDSVEVHGVRNRGKKKFAAPKDESRKFVNVALKLANDGDLGALAALTTLIMGMRASEIAEIRAGDFDNGGKELRIPKAKTHAGIRRLTLPDMLQPLYRKLVEGKGAGDKLFGAKANRHYVLRSVKRLCKASGVTVVSAHGLRGVHAELAVSAGMTGAIIAQALGHENFGVTERHYAGSSSVANAATSRVVDAIN